MSEVAHTILQQLGGRRFVMMTGAKNFVGGNDTLTFMLPGTAHFVKNKARYVRISLTPADLYRVEFLRKKRGTLDLVTISEHDQVYAEDLQPLFTRETGLDTHL